MIKSCLIAEHVAPSPWQQHLFLCALGLGVIDTALNFSFQALFDYFFGDVDNILC